MSEALWGLGVGDCMRGNWAGMLCRGGQGKRGRGL